jgi:deaminated glutathione amidase
MKLSVATCQFPTSADIRSNFQYVAQLMKHAREQGAEVAHFPEACLSGYAGADLESYDGFDWQILHECTYQLIALAGALELWTILGSTHKLSAPHKPHNSLYIISDRGQLLDRYDKRFCWGDASEQTGDLAHYTAGNHLSVFAIKGIRCGALICNDYRYPELYREYKRRGVQLMFHSYHAAHISAKRFRRMEAAVGKAHHALSRGTTYPGITMPATMIAAAASNYMWISCPNSSARESCWGSFFVRADGVITGQLERHSTDSLLSTVDTEVDLYDSTRAWRDRALAGILHSGSLVQDERSEKRTEVWRA